MNDNLNAKILADCLKTLASLFVDDKSKEVFMRRIIGVFKNCKQITDSEKLEDSEINWEYISFLYDSIQDVLYFNNIKMGDDLYIEVMADESLTGNTEKVLVGEVATVPVEVAADDKNMEYYVSDQFGRMHVYKGYFTFKN